MKDIVKKRKIYLVISAVAVLLSLALLFIFGLKLSIDFTGGSRLEIGGNDDTLEREAIERVYSGQNISVSTIQETENGFRISSQQLSEEEKDNIVADLKAEELSFEDLGPSVGSETRDKAILAVIVASIAITIYIAIAFWKSGKAISSWKLGITAIIALLHDVIITLGAFSLFGILLGVEIDALFVTAILTIMGFSMHDTIVVFDRIRENIINNVKNQPFETVVNNSILETVARSLNTSVTVLFVLFAMVLFGGESVRWFVIAFIIGVLTGVYSSIFIASPLLVEWNNLDKNGGFKSLSINLKKKLKEKIARK